MRVVRIPEPRAVAHLTAEGPLPGARDHAEATQRFDGALRAVPGLDEGDEGWTVLWRAIQLRHPGMLHASVYCARSSDPVVLLEALAVQLRDGGFTVDSGLRPTTADPDLTGPPVYVRAGPVRLGLDPRDEPMLRAVRFVAEDRHDVDLGLRSPFRAQACPRCGVQAVPARLVAGFPGPELLLAAHLGEVAFRGDLVDPRARENAACRHCGHEFVAR